MGSSKPRRWFQLHLSTCVVMMLVAGVIIGLNVTSSKFQTPRGREFAGIDMFGWPFRVLYTTNIDTSLIDLAFFLAEENEVLPNEDWPTLNVLSWSRIAANLFVFALILSVTTLACEFVLRQPRAPIVNRKL